MNIVEREIGARERAFIQTNSHAQGLNSGLSTVTAMMAGDGKPKYCYCKQHHPSASCKTVTDACCPDNSHLEEIRKMFYMP